MLISWHVLPLIHLCVVCMLRKPHRMCDTASDADIGRPVLSSTLSHGCLVDHHIEQRFEDAGQALNPNLLPSCNIVPCVFHLMPALPADHLSPVEHLDACSSSGRVLLRPHI